LICLTIGSLFFPGCQSDKVEVRIIVTGDILLSRNVREEIRDRKSFPWQFMTEEFKKADLVFGNLEGAVGSPKDSLANGNASPVFDIDSSDLKLAKKAGFHVLTIENNHSYDLGIKGKDQTVKSVFSQQISPVSLQNSPRFFTIGNQVISLIALNLVPDRRGLKTQLPSLELEQKLSLARTLSNLVIVSVHWGTEWLSWPNQNQREAADWLTRNGADVVIGSHPHVVQEPELVNGKPVYFSLGNHLFDQKYADSKSGLMAELILKNGQWICSGLRTHTRTSSFFPEVVTGEPVPVFRIPNRNSLLQSNGFEFKPVQFDSPEDNRVILKAFKNGKPAWKSNPMKLITITNAKLDGKQDFLFALENHYSNLDKEISLRPYVYFADEGGLVARWRGSAFSWPMLDARINPENPKELIVLHRGDSFIHPDKSNTKTRRATYIWNGFGFTGIKDSVVN